MGHDGEGLIKVQATDRPTNRRTQRETTTTKIIPQWKRYDKEANSISMSYDFFSFFFHFLLNSFFVKGKKKLSEKNLPTATPTQMRTESQNTEYSNIN